MHILRTCRTILIVTLVVGFSTSHATDWRRPGAQREAVEGTRSNSGGGGGGGLPGLLERLFSEDPEKVQARKETVRHYNAIINEGNAAGKAGNYREAARLYRQALKAHETLGETSASREALEAAEHYEKYADATDAGDAGDAANAAGNYALALEYFKKMIRINPASDNEHNRKIIADTEARLLAEQERIKKEEKAAKLERRHRPEVERLRTEARAMMDLRPADALAKLDAALKLLPGDPKTKGDWWLAKASLDQHEGKYDEALQAVNNAKSYSEDSPEITKAQTRIADERNRQGANVQIAFNDLRQRLAAAPNADTAGDAFGTKKSNPTLTPVGARIVGNNTSAGAQAKSAERHGREAQLSGNEAAIETARMGFDISGKVSGNLVYPDKKQQQIPPTALDKKIPRGAQDDKQIKEMQAWYRKLDAEKAEKEKMIAEIKEKQKTSKDPDLDNKIAALNSAVMTITGDQAKATEAVEKRMKNLGIKLVESSEPATAESAKPVGIPKTKSSNLDFIQE